MAPSLKLPLLASLFAHTIQAAEYVWPNKHDQLEDLLAIQDGYRRFGFTDLVVPCGFGSNVEGKQTSAEWIRTGFHDMATHDKAAGTGGLDASIMYELERGENLGAAFNNTLGDLLEFYSHRTSASDLIALGVVAAVASCGGSRIPLRAGRIDATEAGPEGVPEPQDSLDTITSDFERMGFNTEEMIAMVACGHTVGGVHSVDFPDVTGGEASDSNVPKFDSSGSVFDTTVVDEYLASEGPNPLVFGHNETKNSDKRVFGADGNVTMTKLSDPDAFQITCADILERMINTVPSAVDLSEPIELAVIKPYIDKLSLSDDGSKIQLGGEIRIRDTAGHGYETEPERVELVIKDRNDQEIVVETMRARQKGGKSYGFFKESFVWFTFDTELDSAAGVTSFDISITTDSKSETLDNAGTGGYPINDEIIYLSSKSCIDMNGSAANITFNLVAAVREDLVGKLDEEPWINFAHEIQQQGVVLPRLEMEKLPMAKTSTKQGGYQYYKGSVSTPKEGWSTMFDVGITLDGKNVVSQFNRSPSSC